MQVVVLAVVSLAMPLPSSVRYTPVVYLFWLAASEQAGDIGGAQIVLIGCVLWPVMYTTLLYALVLLSVWVFKRGSLSKKG